MEAEKIVLITGSSRGIGSATAKIFGRHGYKVCVNYKKNIQAADKVVDALRQNDVSCISVQADVSKEPDVIRLFNTIDKELGILTTLVNNAGILLPQMRLDKMDSERINEIFSTNVTGYFLCSREAVKRMSTNYGGRGGTIVNVSSAASRIGSPAEYLDYAASKGAIDTLTRGLSLEVATEGIRVNCIRPGFIDTEMHIDGGDKDRIEHVKNIIPMKRGGTTEEVAKAIYWLCSDDSSYATGTFLDLAGGR